MPSVCPACRAPIASPPPLVCPSCGEAQPIATDSFALPIASLAFKKGDRFTVWSLSGRTTIGRAPGNRLILTDPEISKEHAVVHIQPPSGEWMIEDVGSANGTFLNDRPVKSARLRSGDTITVGATRLTFRLGAATERNQVTIVQSVPKVLATAPIQTANFQPVEAIADFEDLKHDYEKLRIAHEFHRALGSVNNPKLICERVLEVALTLLPADSGVVMLREATGWRAAATKTAGEAPLFLSETLLDSVVKDRRGVITADALIDSRFNAAESIVMLGVRSAMAVPLIGSQGTSEVRGILLLDHRTRAGLFTEKDLNVLSSIGVQAGIALENAELAESRERLARYLPPPLVEQVARGAIAIEQRGTEVEGSVLFADLRNFTALAGSQTADKTVALLNRFFELMVEEVFAAGGALDKYLGDGLMALFGMPVPQPDAGVNPALQCALQMQLRMQDLNREREKAGLSQLGMGVGVNTGSVIVGSMGSERRMEYTAIGDAVNVASRFCSIAEAGQILCGEATARRAGAFSLDALPPASIRGKEAPVSIFWVREKKR